MKYLLLSFFLCLFGVRVVCQNTNMDMIHFPIAGIEYEHYGDGSSAYAPSQNMVYGIYSDSLQQLQLRFEFINSATNIVIYKNHVVVTDTAFHISFGMSKTLDFSRYEDGNYLLTVNPSNTSTTYYTQFQLINGKMPRIIRDDYYCYGWIHKQVTNPSLYQYSFDAVTRVYIPDTFSESFHCSSGTNHNVLVISDTLCNVYIFSESHPEVFSHKYMTEWQNDTVSVASVSFSTPLTDNYRILITTAGPSDGKEYECDVYVDNSFVRNSPVSDNYFSFPICADQESAYNIFVQSGYKGHNDPQLYVIGESGTVIAFNDDYVSDCGFDWESNSRVILEASQHISGVVVTRIPIEEMGMLDGFVDIYVGCPVVHESTNIRTYYENYFDNFEDMMVSGPASVEYDHVAWAVGEKNYDNPYLKLFQFSVDDIDKPLAPIDEFLRNKFFTREGANEENSCIDLYLMPDDSICVYATIKAYYTPSSCGYAWESKVGTSERLFHPRYALREYAADGDSVLVIHYRKMHFTEINDYYENSDYQACVFENIELTENELSILTQNVSSLKRRQINLFQTAYDRCKAILSNADSRSIKALLNSSEYANLLSICTQTPEFINYAYINANNGDRLAFILINDIAVPQYPTIQQQVKNYNQTHSITDDGKKIRYNIQANTMLFVKGVIDYETNESLTMLSPNGLSYSNDETAFSVKVANRVMNIDFSLPKNAVVSLLVSSTDLKTNRCLLNRTSKERGMHTVMVPVTSSGLYTISYYVDGRFYEKKVIVN